MRFPLFVNSKDNQGTDSDFTVLFQPPIILDEMKENKLALVSNSMYWSWYNVSSALGNNIFKYSHNSGTQWHTVNIQDGQYTYLTLNNYIQDILVSNGHSRIGIPLLFDDRYYKVKLILGTNYRVDFRTGNVSRVLGFNKAIVTSTTLGPKIPDITYRFIDLCIHIDIISRSQRNGSLKSIIHSESMASGQKVPTRPISYSPRHLLWYTINTRVIDRMRVRLTDRNDRSYQLNGQPMELVFMIINDNVQYIHMNMKQLCINKNTGARYWYDPTT